MSSMNQIILNHKTNPVLYSNKEQDHSSKMRMRIPQEQTNSYPQQMVKINSIDKYLLKIKILCLELSTTLKLTQETSSSFSFMLNSLVFNYY